MNQAIIIVQFLQTNIIHKSMGQVVFIFRVKFFRKDQLQLLGQVVLISSFLGCLHWFVQVVFICLFRLSSLRKDVENIQRGGRVDHFTYFEESVDEAQPIWCHGI